MADPCIRDGAPVADSVRNPGDRARRAAALAGALHGRIDEISRAVLLRWHERSPESASPADLRVQNEILRLNEFSSLAIAEFLNNGKLQREDHARAIAETGKAPLRDTIALGELIKLYLYWRDITIAVLTEESDRLDLERDVLNEAVTFVRAGSDGSIVRMAKQFDAERGRLQRDLAIEQARLEHQAFHDALTGLPNRRLFFDRLSHALALSQRHHSGLGLLYVDIDEFKSCNDRHGHLVGDHVLRTVAERLVTAARASDTVARLGGDEFIVLFEQFRDPQDKGIALAERIVDTFAEPINATDGQVRTSASIGIAVTTEGGDADLLIGQADNAMYRAKRHRRGSYQLCETP